MNNILVTGASGHLGYNLVKKIIDQGVTPRVLFLKDKIPDHVRQIEDRVEILDVDCMDCEALKKAMQDVDTVFHTGTSGQVHDYHLTTEAISPETMVESTANIIRALHENGGKKMIFASSFAFGSSLKEDEAYVLPYYRGKIEAEKKARELSEKFNLKICFVKGSMIIGPDDFVLTPANQFILDVLTNALRFVPRGGVNPVDVRDVADGLIAIAETNSPETNFILSGNDNLYIRELISRIGEHREITMPGSVLSRKKAKRLARMSQWFGDLLGHPALFTREIAADVIEKYAWFDNQETKKLIDWRPRPLPETLEDTIRFLEQKWIDQ